MLIMAVNLHPRVRLSAQIDKAVDKNSPLKRRLTGVCRKMPLEVEHLMPVFCGV